MKKIIYSFVLYAFVAQTFFMPAMANAQTSTTTDYSALIAQIEASIAQMQVQLKAYRDAQSALLGTVKNTMSLIKQLKQGTSGEDVRLLQILLASDEELYPEGNITGYYGPLTSKAVKRFQKKHGLSQVGNVGPMTLKKLNERLVELDLQLGLGEDEDKDDDDQDGDRNEKRLCVKVPPGHLIAPGWLRKNNGVRPIVQQCQTLPPGIIKKLPSATTTSATTTTPTPTPPPPASNSLNISNISASSTTSTSATIMWKTNKFATSWAWYGISTPLTLSAGSNITTKDHSVNLTGLTASITYQFVVSSTDSDGITATSSQQSFSTN